MTERRPRVTRSPSEAAMGVAMLSGLIRIMYEVTTTMIMMVARAALAMEAVLMEDAPRRSMCAMCRSRPNIIDTAVASAATTRA